MNDELDNRIIEKNSNFFMVDNVLIDIYGQHLGAISIGIYISLKRHYNKDTGVCFPSQKTMARQLKLSSRTIIRHIKALQKYNLISKIEESKSISGRWPHNIYFLSSVEDWILPPDFKSHSKDISPGDLNYTNQVTDCHIKKTKINKTNIGIDPSILLEGIRRIGRSKQYRINSP